MMARSISRFHSPCATVCAGAADVTATDFPFGSLEASVMRVMFSQSASQSMIALRSNSIAPNLSWYCMSSNSIVSPCTARLCVTLLFRSSVRFVWTFSVASAKRLARTRGIHQKSTCITRTHLLPDTREPNQQQDRYPSTQLNPGSKHALEPKRLRKCVVCVFVKPRV